MSSNGSLLHFMAPKLGKGEIGEEDYLNKYVLAASLNNVSQRIGRTAATIQQSLLREI